MSPIMPSLQSLQADLQSWIETSVLVPGNAIQAGLILVVLLVGGIAGSRMRRLLTSSFGQSHVWTEFHGLFGRIAELSSPIVWLVLFLLISETGAQTSWFGNHLLQTAASLAGAWVAIRLVSGFMQNRLLARTVAWAVWGLAALFALGLFDAALDLLDGVGMTIGEVRLSLLSVTKAALALVILLWAALAMSRALERRIKRSDGLTPTVQVLIIKVARIVLIALVFLVAIDSLGIDLTTLAVFGGALGIGIGIGLQKVVSNLVSGVLLLLDKSIKPDDVIAVGETYGWVKSLGARYVSVRTRDGIEYLIPNEDLITQRVENWSHSDKDVRVNIPVGISYKSDVRLAIKLCQQAASEAERTLSNPAPSCLLRGFGDSSVNLEIRVWIDDPSEGRANVISEILLRVWELFHESGIEIPYPQRDLHLKSSDVDLSGVGAETAVNSGSQNQRGTDLCCLLETMTLRAISHGISDWPLGWGATNWAWRANEVVSVLSDHSCKAVGIQHRGMDIARGERIAYAQKKIITVWIGILRLGRKCNHGIGIDFAQIAGTGSHRVEKLCHRLRAEIRNDRVCHVLSDLTGECMTQMCNPLVAADRNTDQRLISYDLNPSIREVAQVDWRVLPSQPPTGMSVLGCKGHCHPVRREPISQGQRRMLANTVVDQGIAFRQEMARECIPDCGQVQPQRIGRDRACGNKDGFRRQFLNVRRFRIAVEPDVDTEARDLSCQPISDSHHIVAPTTQCRQQDLAPKARARLEQGHCVTAQRQRACGFQSCRTAADHNHAF